MKRYSKKIKETAILLRQNGLTYSKIANIIGASKKSVIIWCNLKKYKEQYSKDREYKIQYYKNWRKTNIQKSRELSKKWREQNKEQIAIKIKIWRQNNKDKIKQYSHKQNSVVKFDSVKRMRKSLTTRLWNAIHNNYKTGSAIRDLGCSIPEFKKYIETKFQPGMSWGNYGKWHIDHINHYQNLI